MRANCLSLGLIMKSCAMRIKAETSHSGVVGFYASRPQVVQRVLLNILLLLLCAIWMLPTQSWASAGSKLVERDYSKVVAPPSPARQSEADMLAKSEGCMTCHTQTDQPSMHESPGVKLGCTDCHGGNASVTATPDLQRKDKKYVELMESAHVLPRYPEDWHYPSSRNPERTYTLLNRESPEFIRFMNPGDYRIARESCGACHLPIIQAAERSLMSTGAMLWGGASYNNGILPYKRYLVGEAYTRDGQPAMLKAPMALTEEMKQKNMLEVLYPLPSWETIKPGDIFRVFEDGGRNISHLFPETGLPNIAGNIQRLEEPGRPDFKQSNRGAGTGARIAVPVINIHKTRLNDPFSWFMGTNDQPGDYRNSGCSGCHVVYANDRDERHSFAYAKFGHEGKTQTIDPTISKTEEGHPLKHTFSRQIPTSQCMICHMHQPNMFMNTYLGYTMWDYESDAPKMWPEKQAYPDDELTRKILDRNPEGASARGKWGDIDFLKNVSSLNPELKDTQFADYHGHGWNFRAIFKRDREGNLLDKDGKIVADEDPKKFSKAVHMSSIHVDVGMACVDCHFAQDSHGNGHIVGEVALGVEIDCRDCHGTASSYPSLTMSGPASIGATDMTQIRNADGRLRFEWVDGVDSKELIQRSVLDPKKEWKVSLVKDTVTPGNAHYNEKAARAKTMSKNTETLAFGLTVPVDQLAHNDDEMECFTCHTSWTTSCGGCHLPIEANWKTARHHYEGGETRNFATYNPQVARDEMFHLGRQGSPQGSRIAPVRSTSALVLSSTNSNREKIYIQQPPIAASGFSSQAFNTHYPHTERKTETKTCTDCHLSKENDNNAWMAQLMLQGTNFINFVGYYAWVGSEDDVTGVQVTEWEEPQAVIGSYLQKYAYPDFYKQHQARKKQLPEGHKHNAGYANCLQMRGEYLYVAEGEKGFRVYDIASIANKGVSQRIITAPFSALGHDAHIPSSNATCVVLPTTQPVSPPRNTGDLMRVTNMEQPFHPIYNYAVITDAKEGLILTDINLFADGDAKNNHLKRAVTWNDQGVLKGARHVTLGGYYAYVMADQGLVVVNLNDPLKPKTEAIVPLNDGRASMLQFRYLFVTDREGLQVIDITKPSQPRLIANNKVALQDARKVFVSRTYAYVAAGAQGLVIIDVKNPEKMRVYQQFTADGQLNDARDVILASTNATLFAYVADGQNGMKILQMTSPDSQPKFYGFSPAPKPELIAWYPTASPALSLSRPLERDRGVDETGGQVAVFGRLGARPLNLQEMQKLYLNDEGKPWYVTDKVEGP